MTQSEPTLPSNRAFVVQFRAATGSASGRCSGRVEHIVSGQATHFESWEQCQHFIEQTLAQVGGAPGHCPPRQQ